MKSTFAKKFSFHIAAIFLAAGCISATVPAFAQSNADKLSSDEVVKAKAVLEVINNKLAKVGKSKSQLQLIESDEIDIQSSDDDKNTITLSTALVMHFRDDRDAIASLIALQQARMNRKPVTKPEAKKNPTVSKLMDMVGSAVSNAVDGKVGVSGATQTITEGGGEILDKIASQAREKEIDEACISWLLEGGYNPYGAVRAQKSLSTLPEGSKGQKLAANPDRIAYLEALVEDNPKAKAFSADGKTSLLAKPQAAATASTANAATGSATNAISEPVDEPVDGISLSRYAAIKNDVAYKGDSEGLARHGLTAEAFSKIDQQWSARIAQDKNLNLSMRYATHYMEASQGEFADWGRDVAQVKQTGRLQLGTDPTSVDDWIVLFKAHNEAARGGPDTASSFGKAAKDKGLTVYDFRIVNAWWLQRAKEKAAQGDKSLLQRMN